jgi:protein-disulfide isomerase
VTAVASRKAQREQARQERLQREQAEAAAQRRRRMVQLGVGGGLAAAIIVVIAIVVSQSGGGSSGGSATDVTAKADISKQLAGIPQRGNVLGKPGAKVRIVEFGDPQCPVCKAFSEQVAPQIIAGPVRSGAADYQFEPWLIIGPQSKPAADAAMAAGEQGRFWNYIELFYRNQGEENSGYVTDDFMTAIANGAGVPDIAKWDQARQSGQWDAQYKANNRRAGQLGFTGTPSVYVQGPSGRKVFTNVPTASEIEAAIKSVS